MSRPPRPPQWNIQQIPCSVHAATITHFTRPFGKTGSAIPTVVFGTSSLGNLSGVVPDKTKFALARHPGDRG